MSFPVRRVAKFQTDADCVVQVELALVVEVEASDFEEALAVNALIEEAIGEELE